MKIIWLYQMQKLAFDTAIFQSILIPETALIKNSVS